MKNNDIKTTTPVRHPEGGDYVIQRQSMNGAGEVLSVAIGKDLHATAVFDGSPDEARKHGFLFGDETAEPETWEDKDAVIAELKTRNNAMAVELEARSATISDLRGEVTALGGDVTALRSRLAGSETALRDFKERVRNEVEDARKQHDLCLEGCNSFLEELGLPLLSRKWKVMVIRDHDSETLLTVTGVEADDEDAARDEVKENFSVTATVRRVEYDYEYSGEGDADWDYEDFNDTDVSEDDDSFADTHADALTFVVEEA